MSTSGIDEEAFAVVQAIADQEFKAFTGITGQAISSGAATLPELNYWSFSLCQSVLYEIYHVIGPLPGEAGLSWNVLDAFCQGVEGVRQLVVLRVVLSIDL